MMEGEKREMDLLLQAPFVWASCTCRHHLSYASTPWDICVSVAQVSQHLRTSLIVSLLRGPAPAVQYPSSEVCVSVPQGFSSKIPSFNDSSLFFWFPQLYRWQLLPAVTISIP